MIGKATKKTNKQTYKKKKQNKTKKNLFYWRDRPKFSGG